MRLKPEYQTARIEVRRSTRRDKRNFIDDLATQAEQTVYRRHPSILHHVTKTLSNKKPSQTKPLKDKETKRPSLKK